MRRIVAIALDSILVDLARKRWSETSEHLPLQQESPLAVVFVSKEKKDAFTILGNSRIKAVSKEARELGIRSGMTVAAAKAIATDLQLGTVHESEVRQTFRSIAESCLAFGTTTAVSLEAYWHDEEIVWIDITGCAHLYGGERALLSKIGARIREMGFACRVAVANGARVAAAVARFAPKNSRILLIPHGKDQEAMRRLPTAALPVNADTALWLSSLGLRTIRDLSALPRDALGARLFGNAREVFDLLDGEDHVPLKPHRPEILPCERLSLEYGIDRAEQIVFVAKTLCDRMGARLLGRGEGALRMSLELVYDRALVSNENKSCLVNLVLPVPLARANDLLQVIRTRIDALGHQSLVQAPILEVILTVNETALLVRETVAMFEPVAKAERALPRLCAELMAELGENRFGTLAIADAWSPAARSVILPFGSKKTHAKEVRSVLTTTVEPVRILTMARSATDVSDVSLVFRTEDIEWWRKESSVRNAWMTGWLANEQACGFLSVSGRETLLIGWMD